MGKNNKKNGRNKPQKQQTAPIVGNVNVELDYEKLADAIVKAQKRAEEGEKQKKSNVANTFAALNTVLFQGTALFGIVFTIGLLIILVNSIISEFVWLGAGNIFLNIVKIIIALALAAILSFFSILLLRAAKEMEKEKDRQYIVAVFSAITSLAAVIVALVALLK